MNEFKQNLLDLLDEYNTYEYRKVQQAVRDGAPQPVTHPFTLLGFFKWLEGGL